MHLRHFKKRDKNMKLKTIAIIALTYTSASLSMSFEQKGLLRALKLLGHITIPLIQEAQSGSSYAQYMPFEYVTGKHAHLFAKFLPLIFNK